MADLEPVNESWTRALCVVAHPDDLEFGAAAAVARWTDQGKTVVYAMVTSGEAGIDGMHPTRRAGSGRPSRSSRPGSSASTPWSSSGCRTACSSTASGSAICAVVRKHRPEIVITNNFRDTWGGVALNQADHIATGKATLDAARDAGNRWIFSEQLVDGLEPWGGVGQVWAAGSPDGRHGVETTQTFDRGVASLAAHQAYIDGLGWENFDPRSSSKGVRGRRGPGSACRWPRRSRCSLGWGD